MHVLTTLTTLLDATLTAVPAAGVTELRESFYSAILESLKYFSPELQVATAAMVVLLLDLFLPVQLSKHLAWVALLACIVPLSAVGHHAEESRHLFLGMVVLDPFASFFKQFFLLGSIPVILLSFVSRQLEGRRMGEYYFILLSSVFGAMLMASSTHFLTLFLSLEILSVCSYVLVGFFRTDRRGAEAALKYIIYGSIAAAIMGYGFSLWYGMTGSGDIASLARVSWDPSQHPIWSERNQLWVASLTMSLAFLFVFIGFAYKIASIPMHFWAPDVYEGAPTVITAFLSVISKAAGFAITLRFLGALAASITGLPPAAAAATLWRSVDWQLILILISIVTMTFGNLAALWQTNLKRLMAYSSIAHAGYLMMGLTLLGSTARYGGEQTIAFYLVAYLAMNFGAFAVAILVENRLGSADLEAYRGLGRRSPFLAGALTVFLFSLIGVPPTAGFMGKFHLFMGILDHGGTAYYVLALAAALNTAISAYYYLNIAKVMYFEKGTSFDPIPSSALGRVVVAGMLFLTFYLCFFADSILKTTLKLHMHV